MWQRGVRPHASEQDADRYQAARDRDPDFSTLINAYSKLAASYREKREVELEIASNCRQLQILMIKQGSVKKEYERIKAQEEVEEDP